jgi:ABC-type multidrug transport system fused ATPase/permease subunit
MRKNRIFDFLHFLGKDVNSLMIKSMVVGLLWFICEASFVFIMQGFLVSIGMIDFESTFLPGFYPKETTFAVYLLFIFGSFRFLILSLKEYYSIMVNQTFVSTQRDRIIKVVFLNNGKTSSHEIINVFNDQVYRVASVVQCFGQFIASGISSFLFFLFGLYLAPIEITLSLIFLLILIYPLKVMNKKVSILGEQISDLSVHLSKMMVDNLKNFFLVSLYSLQDRETKKTQDMNNKFVNIYETYSRYASFKNSFPQLAGILIITGVTLLAISMEASTPIVLVSFIYIFMRLAQGLGELSIVGNMIRLNLGGFKALFYWFEAIKNLEKDNKLKLKTLLPEKIKKIEITSMTYGYITDTIIFDKLNFSMTSGDIVVIKGQSGVGKSTLLKLITGMINPISGYILINDMYPLSETDVSNAIGYVGPESYLVEGTVRENLLYPIELFRTPDDDMKEYLKRLGLFDTKFQLNLDKKLSEDAELSTGQRQRLAIVRALLRKPSLLILDEATANLDTLTEVDVIKTISELSIDKITVIVTHKDSFDHIATKKIRLPIA